MEEGSGEGMTELRIPLKVGNRNTVSFPVTILQKWAVSCRWIACSDYRNNDASPLFLFVTQKNVSMFIKQKGSPEQRSALTRLRVERPGVRIPDRIRYLTPVQNVRTGCGAHPASGPMGTGVFYTRSKDFLHIVDRASCNDSW